MQSNCFENVPFRSGNGKKESVNHAKGKKTAVPAAVRRAASVHERGRARREQLGLASGKDPAKVEQQLRAILPPEESSDFCHRLVLHGRAVCAARKPACDRCCLAPYCKSFTGE